MLPPGSDAPKIRPPPQLCRVAESLAHGAPQSPLPAPHPSPRVPGPGPITRPRAPGPRASARSPLPAPRALTSEPRPRVRGRRGAGGAEGAVRAPVPRPLSRASRGTTRSPPGRGAAGRGLSPGPRRAGVRSGGVAARRPDRGRAVAASPPPPRPPLRLAAPPPPPPPRHPPPSPPEPRKTRRGAARSGGRTEPPGRPRERRTSPEVTKSHQRPSHCGILGKARRLLGLSFPVWAALRSRPAPARRIPLRVLRAPAAADTFFPGCGPGSEGARGDPGGADGLGDPGVGKLGWTLVPRRPRGWGAPPCSLNAPPPASPGPLCDSRCSLALSGPGWSQTGWQPLGESPGPPPPRGPQPQFPWPGRALLEPKLGPGGGVFATPSRPGPGCDQGIPWGLRKGSSDWLRPSVTSGPPGRPLPQRHVGAIAAGEGAGGPGGFGVSPRPVLAAGRRRRDSPRTGFPGPPAPPPGPPKAAAARAADAPAKSAQLVSARLSARSPGGGVVVLTLPCPLSFDPCLPPCTGAGPLLDTSSTPDPDGASERIWGNFCPERVLPSMETTQHSCCPQNTL
uniref:Basic proline-rich protein-like n=1 Tax=Castor canadensis TaxID=51338 RepID=A0A8B7UQ67_CASCN|nr:basic proline-rich protein-like [Castor canadensis]